MSANAGDDMGKEKCLIIVGGGVNLAISMEGSQKATNRATV